MSLVVTRHGAVLVLRIDRPERSNALDGPTSQAIGAQLLAAETDDAIAVLVITGTGDRSFCAGADLKAFAAAEPLPPGTAPPPGVDQLTERYYAKPVIAAVNGAAVGGGFGLVLGCDLVVAAEHATFGTPEVRRGLVGVGVTSRAVLRLPPAVVLEMALTGDPITAAEAHRLGIVNRVVAAPHVVSTAIELAQRIAENPAAAVLAAKDVVYAAAELHGRFDLAALRARADHVMRSPQARAGAQAFVDRRKS